MTVRVGLVGTSWWADAMYLPALKEHPHGKVVAVCGRSRPNAERLAAQWGIESVFTDYAEMFASGSIDAAIISTTNDTHFPIAMRAIDAGLHVLCEKPLALNASQARQMAEAAQARGIKHMVPFTYSFTPTTRYLKSLIDQGYIGQPYHLNLRYYAGYGRSGEYLWRFDQRIAGSGALGDIGSHFLYLARLFFGEVAGLYAHLGTFTRRPPLDPTGQPYTQTEDTAIVTLAFQNGAEGIVHASTQAYEDSKFGQQHHYELHGSAGTLYYTCDWNTVQQIKGARVGEGLPRELTIPDGFWMGARRDNVVDGYHDVFRKQDHMTRQWVTAIAEDRPARPDFSDGLAVQRLIDAGLLSHQERRWVSLDEITG